jgi:O-acetyl-ADP-ribose deacetylase (regulator of RNase III)
MLQRAHGNLLHAETDAIVNTVNTVGVMGKGLALQFAEAFPENTRIYARACRAGEVRVGKMLVVERDVAPRFIVNFPTKQHWRSPSQLAWIEEGLTDLVAEVRARRIASIAIPPLGCGLGGLSWADVKPRIEAAFAALPDVRVLVYEPEAPMEKRTKRRRA